MDTNVLVGDAFESDKQNIVAKGLTLPCDPSSTVNYDYGNNVPDSKACDVSMMKEDMLPALCRNVVSSSSEFICYAVKKNLIRVIDNKTTFKGLLRGHTHPLLDMRFSAVNSANFCSIDSGDDFYNEAKVHIWSLSVNEDAKKVEETMIGEYNIPALICKSHTSLDATFGIGHKKKFGIISATTYGSNGNSSPIGNGTTNDYEALPVSGDISDLEEDYEIYDMAFSLDGSRLVIAAVSESKKSSIIRVWEIPDSIDVGSRIHLSASNANEELVIDTVLVNSITFISDTSVAFVIESGSIVSVCYYDVLDSEFVDFENIGSVESRIARVDFKMDKDTAEMADKIISKEYRLASKFNLISLENCLDVASMATKERMALLTCRESNFAVCFGIGTYKDGSFFPGYLSHMTMIDLKGPTISADAKYMLTSDEDHHSTHKHLYLEITCFQERGSGNQSAVVQYQVSVPELCSSHAFKEVDEFPCVNKAKEQESEVFEEYIDPNYSFFSTTPVVVEEPVKVEEETSSQSIGNQLLGILNGRSSKKKEESKPAAVEEKTLTDRIREEAAIAEAEKEKKREEEKRLAVEANEQRKLEKEKKDLEQLNLKAQKEARMKAEQEAREKRIRENKEKEKEKSTSSVSVSVSSDSVPRLPDVSLSESQIADIVKREVTKALESKQWQSKVVGMMTPMVTEATNDAFIKAFEGNLVPAFESGVTAMCSQIQQAVDGELIKQNLTNFKLSSSHSQSLKNVQDRLNTLEEHFQRTNGMLKDIIETINSNGTGKTSIPEKELTPKELLEAGMLPEAVEASLELKDISNLVSLLAEMSPAQMIEGCSATLILCATQQLATDLSRNHPSESYSVRLDWIQNLVVHIAGHKHEMSNKEQTHTVRVMNAVKNAIDLTQERLEEDKDIDSAEKSKAVLGCKLLIHCLGSVCRF